MDIKDVNGIGKTTSERMRAAGIDTVEKLASITVDELLKVIAEGKTKYPKSGGMVESKDNIVMYINNEYDVQLDRNNIIFTYYFFVYKFQFKWSSAS